ncbi:MAG: DUF2752 domain-containing protein [Comamonadaceae bacterium]|nr:DUF2752 domain-containing protein [Comamonadaceae bacterium]
MVGGLYRCWAGRWRWASRRCCWPRACRCAGFRHLTGQPCPLCGGTHACAALAQGDLMVAWQANPGLMPLFVIAAARAAQLAWEAWTGRRVTRWRIGPALWKAGGLFLIGSWALRLAGVL